MQLFAPDVVIILGDVFDEGNWVNQQGFDEYVERFKSIFEVPVGTRLYAIHGNHDVSFHYQMHPFLINRFNRAFNTSGVNLIREKKKTKAGKDRIVNFVSVNSMAMERDGCNLCNEAEFNVKSVAKKLNKLKERENYSKPILLQHFPNFRENDDKCLDKNSINKEKFREKWETLSQESTSFISRTLEPRAFFSGHSHHHCRLKNSEGIDEFTLASFNWRNINNPSFVLAIFTPNDFSVSRCDMPKESTVTTCYAIGCLLSIIFAIFSINLNTLKNKLMPRSKTKKEVE